MFNKNHSSICYNIWVCSGYYLHNLRLYILLQFNYFLCFISLNLWNDRSVLQVPWSARSVFQVPWSARSVLQVLGKDWSIFKVLELFILFLLCKTRIFWPRDSKVNFRALHSSYRQPRALIINRRVRFPIWLRTAACRAERNILCRTFELCLSRWPSSRGVNRWFQRHRAILAVQRTEGCCSWLRLRTKLPACTSQLSIPRSTQTSLHLYPPLSP